MDARSSLPPSSPLTAILSSSPPCSPLRSSRLNFLTPIPPLLFHQPLSFHQPLGFHTPAPPPLCQPLTTIQPKASPTAFPPLSSDGPDRSPNASGTAAQCAVVIGQRSQKKRLRTLAASRTALFDAEAARQQREADARQCALELAETKKVTYFKSVLQGISGHGYSFGQLVMFVSDPETKQGDSRWDGMLRDSTFISRILNLWSSKATETTREQVRDWAVKTVLKEVRKEAQQITASQFLQTHWRPTNSGLVLGFNLSKIESFFRKSASTLMALLEAMATSPKQLKEMKPVRVQKKAKVIVSSALALLGEYSHSNNWAKKAIGLYLYSTGSQRQPLSVMSHMGISESYNTITGKSAGGGGHEGSRQGGSLRQLSASMVDMARAVASTGLFATSYDNINMVFRAVEQIVGRTDAIENGTCSTIWPLFKADIKDMQVEDLLQSFNEAPPLSIHDIILNPTDSASLKQNLTHCILRIIVTFGGDPFKKFGADLERTALQTAHKIDLHQTPLHPLPAFDIDESTIVGGAEVVDAVFDVLEIKKLSGWSQIVKIFCGDQLTIARLRSLVNIRAGHEGGYTGFGWGVWMPGLFHAKMADIHGVFITHWGKPSSGPRNPACLAFHNTVLQRKPILLTSLPPFRACRDLIFISLYGRVLHCLLLVAKKSTLDEYSEDMTWDCLVTHATAIIEEYTNADRVADLRWQRKCAVDPDSEGDMIFENAILFLRDALLSREFTDAIKAGDSGRVVLVLKTWALSFRGSGRTKYAHEMLHLIHNIVCVWPEPIRDIVFNNWLINTTGKSNSWLEVDLMQEHMNFWIKNFYRAHGSAASWAWLEMIAPCINILRDLGRSFKEMLGTDIGTAHHPMDLSVDLPDLMQSLEDHEVYAYKKGRHLDDDDLPVNDIISSGLSDLLSGKTNPLDDYNTAFQRLQARRRLPPLVDDLTHSTSPASTLSTTTVASVMMPLALNTSRTSSNSGQDQVNDVQSLVEDVRNSDSSDSNRDMQDSDVGDGEALGIIQSDNESDNGLAGAESDHSENEDIGDFLRSFEETLGGEQYLSLSSAADVSLDMDAEDLGLVCSDDEEESDHDDPENTNFSDSDLQGQ